MRVLQPTDYLKVLRPEKVIAIDDQKCDSAVGAVCIARSPFSFVVLLSGPSLLICVFLVHTRASYSLTDRNSKTSFWEPSILKNPLISSCLSLVLPWGLPSVLPLVLPLLLPLVFFENRVQAGNSNRDSSFELAP